MLRLSLLLLVCAIGGYGRGTGPKDSSANVSSGDGGGKLGLWKGPQPGEGEEEVQGERKHSKRQFYLPPPYQQQIPQQPQYQPIPQYQQPQYQQIPQQSQYHPFLPVYIPYRQVVEVHHVVMLQQPPTCPPVTQHTGPYPPPGMRPTPQTPDIFPYPPVTSPPAVNPTTDSGLDDRAGPMGGQTNTTMPRRPSRCVWAIVACCSPDSTSIRYSCFELLGCPGAFWGVNPCEPKVVQAAANTALNFYMSGGSDEGDITQNRV